MAIAPDMIRKFTGMESPEALRAYQQYSEDEAMRVRRALVGVSLTGIAAMGIVTLLQTGLIRHLPDPPVGNFHSDKVNSSHEAYRRGMPDAPLAIAAHALNLVLAALGGKDRARRTPWLPLLATLVAVPQAATAGQYLFHQMPKVDKAWCPYCIVDALTMFATLGLSLRESFWSARALIGRGRAAPAS